MGRFVEVKEDSTEGRHINSDKVYYDTGCEEVIIHRSDIAKAVALTAVDINASIIDLSTGEHRVVLTTYGCFLNKCDLALRGTIIEELVAYQLQQKEIGEVYYIEE